jgi:hypothetical protein
MYFFAFIAVLPLRPLRLKNLDESLVPLLAYFTFLLIRVNSIFNDADYFLQYIFEFVPY